MFEINKQKIFRLLAILAAISLFLVSIVAFFPARNPFSVILECNIPNPWIDDPDCFYEFRSTPHLNFCIATKDPKCIAKIFYKPYICDADFWTSYSVAASKIKENKLDSEFEALLQDNDWEVRAGSVLLIGYLNRKQSKALLYPMLKDQNDQISGNARIILDYFNGNTKRANNQYCINYFKKKY